MPTLFRERLFQPVLPDPDPVLPPGPQAVVKDFDVANQAVSGGRMDAKKEKDGASVNNL